jgi:hypothetical protein
MELNPLALLILVVFLTVNGGKPLGVLAVRASDWAYERVNLVVSAASCWRPYSSEYPLWIVL